MPLKINNHTASGTDAALGQGSALVLASLAYERFIERLSNLTTSSPIKRIARVSILAFIAVTARFYTDDNNGYFPTNQVDRGVSAA